MVLLSFDLTINEAIICKEANLGFDTINGTIGRSHGGIFIILINAPHLFLSFLFTSCILCYL